MLCSTAAMAQTQVEAFVSRFYSVILDRSPANGEDQIHIDALNAGTSSGADIARGFILSLEYVNRGRTNEQFVNDLYSAFFDRAADSGGFTQWITELNNGALREDIVWQFIMSQEFGNLAGTYGIVQANTQTTQKFNVRQFVRRFYQKILNREPDAGGIANWENALINGSLGGGDLALAFIWSAEYVGRNQSFADYLETHYQAFFNRSGDAGGVTNFTNAYNSGTNGRRSTTTSFIGSQEFINLANSFNINPNSTATGSTLAITGNVADGGSATAGNTVEITRTQNSSTVLFDQRVTDSSGNFNFTTAPGSTIEQYVVTVKAAP
jgi:hypothetical protein